MQAEKLAVNSQFTCHPNRQETLDAHAAGFRNVEPRLNLVEAWLEDGHTVEGTRGLFASRVLSVVAGSQPELERFGSPSPWRAGSLGPARAARTVVARSVIGRSGAREVACKNP